MCTCPQDRDNDFVKPSYVPKPFTTPIYQPERGDEAKPLYKPPPSEFRPSEKVGGKAADDNGGQMFLVHVVPVVAVMLLSLVLIVAPVVPLMLLSPVLPGDADRANSCCCRLY
eukprot:355908-Chlamydomonas_euryale.AAC.5